MEPWFSAGGEACFAKSAQACARTQASTMLQMASREVTVPEARMGHAILEWTNKKHKSDLTNRSVP